MKQHGTLQITINSSSQRVKEIRLLVINENVGGLKYCSARGEIQRPLQDYLMRKQLCPRHFCQSGTKVGGPKMIRYRPSPNCKLFQLKIRRWDLSPDPFSIHGKPKCLGSGGSTVARLKLKRIDGKTHKEWSLRLNSTQHGKTYQDKIAIKIDRLKSFHDFLDGGAWPFLVRELICLVNSDNVRDLNI